MPLGPRIAIAFWAPQAEWNAFSFFFLSEEGTIYKIVRTVKSRRDFKRQGYLPVVKGPIQL